jgi:hypothetical protein
MPVAFADVHIADRMPASYAAVHTALQKVAGYQQNLPLSLYIAGRLPEALTVP